MKLSKLFFTLALFSVLSNAVNAQLKVVPIGRVNIGNEPTMTFDPDNLMTLSLFGRGSDMYRAGSKISFGDIGSLANSGLNIFVGEFSNYDSDILQLHGNAGIRFTINGAGTYEVGRFDGNNFHVRGTVTANSSIFSSDFSLKKNVKFLNSQTSLQSLLKLQGVTFDWKTDKEEEELQRLQKVQSQDPKEKASVEKEKKSVEKTIAESTDQVGFIAQDVQKVFPQLVKTTADGKLAINYVALIPLLVEAIKDQQAQIAEMRARLEKLEKK